MPQELGADYFIELAKILKDYTKWIKDFQISGEETIIDISFLSIIYNRFSDILSNEIKEDWITRFKYPTEEKIKPISVSKDARMGSSKLGLIAILAAIQELNSSQIDYEQFVLKQFGIKAFNKMKHDHKEKESFLLTLKICQEILRK